MNTHTILPEEVLHEILQLCFRERTLEDIFTGYHPPHYLEDPRGIPTQLLLVCKQWLRVATPLLYETVQLRSDADVVKLARTLISTPSLGPYIHNLYLNGGYGHKLHDVVRHAPNICTLYVELHLLSKLPISGLLHALPRMNPTQVFVHGYDWGNVNKKTSTTTRAFFDALGSWKSLKLLTFVGMLSAEETLLPRVLEAIEKAPALPEIGFEQYTLEQLLSQPKFCSAMSHGTGLKRIRCYGMDGSLDWDKERWQNVPEEVKEHIVYEETHFYAMRAKWLDGLELCID